MSFNYDSLLPDPKDIEISVKVEDLQLKDELKETAVRRGCVRNLLRMGYDASQIYFVLQGGVGVGKSKIKFKVSPAVVKNDIEYVEQEDLVDSAESSLQQTRIEIIGKLKFLYNQAIREYSSAVGVTKNSFMNTALAILNKRSELEGIKSPDNINLNLNAEAQVSKYAIEFQEAAPNDRNAILTAVRAVLRTRPADGAGEMGIPSEPSPVRTQTTDDEGVPGKS